MATDPNPAAMIFIVTIDGKRCTAIPKALTTVPAAPPAITPMVPLPAALVPAAAASSSSSTAPHDLPAQAVPIAPAIPADVLNYIASPTVPPATTPSSSSQGYPISTPVRTPKVVAVNEVYQLRTVDLPVSTSLPGTNQSSVTSGTANLDITTVSIIGGVSGAMGLVVLLILFIWLSKRKWEKRDSLLTPLNTGSRNSFYDADGNSEELTKGGEGWNTGPSYQNGGKRSGGTAFKAGLSAFGASLRPKVSASKDSALSVNLDRGNSQFVDGKVLQHRIPQHSRNSSEITTTHGTKWWQRMFFRRQSSAPVDHFTATRGMNEKQANPKTGPAFNHLLGMDEREFTSPASLANGGMLLPIGSLGPSFESNKGMFASPSRAASTTAARSHPYVATYAHPNTSTYANPFMDPASGPRPGNSDPFEDPTMPKASTHIAHARHSGEQSASAANGPPGSRYPLPSRPPSVLSLVAQNVDGHYRDTVFTTFSESARRGKGRSDPFDLERPELWKPNELTLSNLEPVPLAIVGGARRSVYGPTHAHTKSTYTASRYSSGPSVWGDPGTDVGMPSESAGSSLMANAGSNGGSLEPAGGQGFHASLEGQMGALRRDSSSAYGADVKGGRWGEV